MRTKLVCFLVVGSLWATACGNSEAPSAPPAPALPPAAPPAAAAAAPGPSVTDPTFDLRLIGGDGARIGEGAPLRIELTAKGGYHVNQEYPIRVNFTAPSGVVLSKSQFQRPDAAEFGESSARFETVATSVTAGTHRITADVDFAVCSDQNCIPDRRTLALELAVR